MTISTLGRASGRLVAGSAEARQVSAAGGAAIAARARTRRLHAAVETVVEHAPALSEQQIEAIAAAFERAAQKMRGN